MKVRRLLRVMVVIKMVIVIGLVFDAGMFYSYSAVAAQSVDHTEMKQFIDEIVQKEMEKSHIPNLSVAVVSNGEVVMEKGYGYANRDTQQPVESQTLFRIGSVSKVLTWTAVMQLVEQGKLDLEEDVNTYIDGRLSTDLATNIEREGQDVPNAIAPITLKDLMTHTPGFEDYAMDIFTLVEEELPSLQSYIIDDQPARVFPAGEVVAYSNYGTALAGYIVEQVSGVPFSEYVQQNIFTPLRMTHSSFEQPLPTHLEEHLAQPYRYIDGQYEKGSFEFVSGPAGAMSSSAADMAAFMNALLQEGGTGESRILEPQSVMQMMAQQFTHHPDLNGMTLGFIERNMNGWRTLFHGGSTMLYDTGLYLIPEAEVGVFISYSGGNYLTHTAIFGALMDQFFPFDESTEAMAPVSTNGMNDRAKEYIGEYHQNRKAFTTSDRIISLTMGMIHVDMDEDGYLIVSHAGETSRFIETEPGMYKNVEQTFADPYGDFQTIVFQTDPFGKTMLTTDGAMTYSKASWFETSAFTFSALMLILLFVIGTLLYWGFVAFIKKIRGNARSQTSKANGAEDYLKTTIWPRATAIVYGFVAVSFVVGVAVTSEFDPLYQMPVAAFEQLPAWSPIIDLLPFALVAISVILLAWTGMVWWKRNWTVMSRVHYTLFTTAALVLTSILSYWNMV